MIPEGHPTDDELIEWRELSREQAELWDSEIDMRLVAVVDALLGERAAHTATKAALRSLVEVIDGVRDEVQHDESIDWVRFDISEPWRSKAEDAVLALFRAQSAVLSISGEFGESSK